MTFLSTLLKWCLIALPCLVLMGWVFGGWTGLELALAVLLRPFLFIALYSLGAVFAHWLSRRRMPARLRSILFFRI